MENEDVVLKAVERLRKAYPDWRLGQTLVNASLWARGPGTIYDVEDSEIVRAIDEHLRQIDRNNYGK